MQLKAAGFHAGVDTEAAIGEPVATRVLEEHENPQWLDLIHGTPAFTPDGRLICAVNDMEHDTNRLSVDGVPFTPVGWQVRQVWTSPIPTCLPSSPAPRKPPATPGSAHGMMTRICTMPAAAMW